MFTSTTSASPLARKTPSPPRSMAVPSIKFDASAQSVSPRTSPIKKSPPPASSSPVSPDPSAVGEQVSSSPVKSTQVSPRSAVSVTETGEVLIKGSPVSTWSPESMIEDSPYSMKSVEMTSNKSLLTASSKVKAQEYADLTKSPRSSVIPVKTPSPIRSPVKKSAVKMASPVRSSSPGKTPSPVRSSSPGKTPSPVRSSSPGKTPSPVRSSSPGKTPSPVRSSSPGKPFKVTTTEGVDNKASLENNLLEMGYAILSKIMIENDNIKFVKAVNKNGQIVYIMIDQTAYASTKNIIMASSKVATIDLAPDEIKTGRARVLPYSVKISALECAKFDVCGVAFECKDKICFIDHDDHLKPRETNFVYLTSSDLGSDYGVGALEDEEVFLVYPVVRLSEIKANANLVLNNTDIITKKLRNTAYLSLESSFLAGQNDVIAANNGFNIFSQNYQQIAAQINVDITELERLNQIYINNPPNNDEDKQRFRDVQFNLRQRNEYADDLLRLMRRVNENHQHLIHHNHKLQQYINFAAENFKNLGQIARQ